jgi:hypothetical protein
VTQVQLFTSDGPSASDSSFDPAVPASNSVANSYSNGSVSGAATARFGGISTYAQANMVAAPVAESRDVFAEGRWIDTFTLSAPGQTSAILLVDVSYAAALSASVGPDPLYDTNLGLFFRQMSFVGSFSYCGEFFSNCATVVELSQTTRWQPDGTANTSINTRVNGVPGFQILNDQFLDTIDFQRVARIEVDTQSPFTLQGRSSCSIVMGGEATAGCDAPEGFLWGGIVGVTDRAGNALSGWTLTAESGLDYRTAFPLSPPAAGGVPEPASWAMLIAGFGLVGAMSRRRRQAMLPVVAG